jgi:hypothetical protein
MNSDLIFDLLELAISLARPELDGDDSEHILITIVQTGVAAYKDHTGEEMDPDLKSVSQAEGSGRTLERWLDIEAEIERVLGLHQSDWIAVFGR